MATVQVLQGLLRPLAQVASVVDDSLMLAGSEAYAAALVFYPSAKIAQRSAVPGAATMADDLGARFLGRSAGSRAPAAAVAASAAMAPAGPAAGPAAAALG